MVFRSLKKTRKNVCVFFTTVCISSNTNTTSKPSHHNHSIIPLSNHHTKIIPKSIELIYIYYIHIYIMHSNWIAHQTTRNSYINNSMESKDARELLSLFQTYYRPSTTDRLLSHKALSLYIIIARASLSLSLSVSLSTKKNGRRQKKTLL